jgi:hydroxymethylbilane synthase
MFHKDTIRIGTRKSALALAQSKLVGDAIINSFPHIKIEYVPMNTVGDKRLDISLQEIGGKGLFTKELEEALINGDIDLAVHSAKDLPLEFDNRLKLMPVLKRAAVNDILVVKKDLNTDIRSLPKGFRIGTSSKRRSEQLRILNKDIEIFPIRGNVITRIGKIFSGEVDGVILARAGIDRLIADNKYATEYSDILNNISIFDIKERDILPAPAQGILCAEYANDDMVKILEKIQDKECESLFIAERRYLSLLQADCHTSAGIFISAFSEKYSIKAYFDGKYMEADNIEKTLEKLLIAIEELAGKLKRENV